MTAVSYANPAFADALHAPTACIEESKTRSTRRLKNRLAPLRQPVTSQASAATRFARQGVRELQMQAALDHELFVFAVL